MIAAAENDQLPKRGRFRLHSLPLRFTLVAALLVLAALGLLASGVAVTSALENSLTQRTDKTLYEAVDGWAKPHSRDLQPPSDVGPGTRPPSPFFVRTVTPDGRVIILNDKSTTTEPDLSKDSTNGPITVGSSDGSDVNWRVLTTVRDGTTTTIGVRLTDNEQTVDDLVGLQLGIGLVVLLILGGAAYFVVRRSLRPLVEVEETAAAIAHAATFIDVFRSAMTAPRSVDCPWRSTECSRRFSTHLPRPRLRRNRPGVPRRRCVGLSATRATSCAHP